MGKSAKRKKTQEHSGGKPPKKAKKAKPSKSAKLPDPPEPLGSPASQAGVEDEPRQRIFKTKPKYWVHNLPDDYGKSAGLSWYDARLILTAQG